MQMWNMLLGNSCLWLALKIELGDNASMGPLFNIIKVVSTKHYRHCLLSKCLLFDNLSISWSQPRVRYFVVILEVIQGQTDPNYKIEGISL